MIELHTLKIDKNIERYEFDRLLNYVSDKKKERIRRFYQFEDAQRSLFGDLLAQYAVCKRAGVKSRDLYFGTNEYGKPILLKPQGIHFNISHSGNWVICAVDNNLVGVDVEIIKPIDLKIAERFFSKKEYLFLINKPEELHQNYFYKIWTLKESFIKAEGRGLSIPLNSFSIHITDEKICIVSGSETEYSFYQSFLDDTTIYALCSIGNSIIENTNWRIKQFLDEVSSLDL